MAETFHPEKGVYIRSLKPGDRFIGFFVLRSRQLEPFRDPSRGVFLSLVVSDRSGQMLARVWENAEDVASSLEPKTVIKLDGEVETYLDRSQIRVLKIRAAKENEYDLQDMLPTSQRDLEEMLAELDASIEQITDPHLRQLVDYFFEDPRFRDRFKQAPAARKIHHAYLGGLLEHVLEVLHICRAVLEIYPQINRDLLLTGALLHDIGKLREYTWDFDIDYSDEGRLLGHIVMTDELVTDALASKPEFPAELSMRLRHMLLSHHGRFEWGSPRRPKTLEAIALHQIENLDAQINRFDLLIRQAPTDESWTPYDRLLGRYLYTGEGDDLVVEERGFTE